MQPAKVEQAVLIVERWLLGRLRHRSFHSLADVNAAIGELLTRLNEERPIRRLGVTRRQLLEQVDRPVLKPLPGIPYVLAEWRIRRVSLDYHVEVEAHYYSVPHRFARAEVEVRFTARTVEIFYKGERIAVHQRMSGNHRHTTAPEHMASSHRRYAGWMIGRIRQDAAAIGPAAGALCNLILDERSLDQLHLRKSDRPALVRAVIDGSDDDPKSRVAAALIIVFRYRNNLFHGVKWQYQLAGQLDNFTAANAILMKVLERHGMLATA